MADKAEEKRDAVDVWMEGGWQRKGTAVVKW